jgi:hypothetical protein
MRIGIDHPGLFFAAGIRLSLKLALTDNPPY